MLRFLLFALLFCGSVMLCAVPAYPGKVSVLCENGALVYITLKGDEYRKWAVSEDSHVLLPDSSGWVYAQEDANGFAVPSSFRLSPPGQYTDALKKFLSGQKKNILPYSSRERDNNVSLRSAMQKSPAVGNRKALVILMSFKDLGFVKAHEDFDALFNEAGYSAEEAQGSVHDYFMQASYGQLNFTCDIFGPYRANNNMSYYGGNNSSGNDKNPGALFLEALQKVIQEVNLSEYDANGDGYVDNIHLIFAGYGEEAGASPSAIWSHEATFWEAIVVQGMKIGSYSCAPELRGNKGGGISRIGPHCHEMGHVLGAMDYYDTDYNEGGGYEGTGKWDIMASGSWNNDGITPANFNPYVKAYDFGWVNVQLMQEGYTTLQSSSEVINQIYRINTPVSGEYYLLENRQKTGFDSALPGEGLLVYHIHKDIEQSLPGNTVNSTHPQKCYPVCASSSYSTPGASAISYGNINSAGCPFPGSAAKRSFDDATTPSAKCWDGSNSNVKLSDITLNDDKTVTLYSVGASAAEEYIKIWSDGFEQNDFSSSWETLQEQGNYAWQRTSVEDGPPSQIKDELILQAASEGKNYICMKNKTTPPDYDLSPHVSILILSAVSLNPESAYKLTFRYQNKAIKSRNGSLSIVYKTEYADTWTTLATYTDLCFTWITKEILLPPVSEKYQLALKGELALGGIFVDDLQLFRKNEKDNAVQPVEDAKDFVCYYDRREDAVCLHGKNGGAVYIFSVAGSLFGKRQIIQGKNLIKLPSGIYILVRDGQRAKVLVP